MPNAAKALGLMRVLMGLWLVCLVLPNLDHSFLERLPGMLEQYAQTNPFGFYRWFLLNVGMPYSENVGSILSVGQLLVGAALMMGFLTRFTAALGLFYTLNFYLATGHLDFYHTQFAVLMGITFLCLSLGDAGHAYGLDGLLFKPADNSGPPPNKMKFKDKKQQKIVDALNKQVKAVKKKTKAPAR